MNVVAPHLSLWSHISWQACAEYPALVMDQPWQLPSVSSLTYGSVEGGTEGGGVGGDAGGAQHITPPKPFPL